MGTSAIGLGEQAFERGQQRREQLEDEQRKATLDTLLEDSATPQDKVAAIQAVYHKDPGVLKQHVENLTRRLTGKQPQPVVSPQQAQVNRLAPIAARGVLPAEQQQRAQLAGTERAIQWVQGLPPDQQKMALQMLGIKATPKWVNIRNPQTGETAAVDETQGIPPGWVLASTTSGAVRSLGYGISPRDAIQAMQTTGQQLTKPGGGSYTAQELAALPPNSQLRAFAVGNEVYYGIADQTQHTVTLGNIVYPMDQFGQVDTSRPLGPARVGSVTTDPFGVTSSTRPQGSGAFSTPQPAPSASTPTGTTPQSQARPVQGQPGPRKVLPQVAKGQKALDANGHIPASAGNPQLVQAANSILDGMDVDKLPIPQRDRAAAMALASEYGYKGQGLFTPREVLQLKEGATVIQKMLDSSSLAVLDKGTIANLPMLGQSADPSKANLFGRLATSLASKAASPQQQEFLRYWRQLDALAIGLRGLVQTGRATQAQVERLIAELPNPYNTTSSEDAKNRLRLVQNELKVAADTGKLPDVPLGQPAGAGNPEVWVRDKNGKLVKQ